MNQHLEANPDDQDFWDLQGSKEETQMKFLLNLVVVVIIFIGLGMAYAQEENMVLLYKFDEKTGDTARDLSGKGNDGAIIDAEWVPEGKFGGGMEFNGTSSLIEVPHNDNLNPGGDQLSILAWFKPTSFPAGHPPIARKGQVGAGVGCWGFDTPTGTLRGFTYMAKDGVAQISQGGATMTQGEWNHVAMIYDGKELNVYLNGELDGSIPVSGDINENAATSVWIGKKANESVFLNGIMDEIAILNVGISEAQLKTYMEGGITIAVEPSGKLAASWGEIKSQ
ncbi:LamG domain-containing protein [Candidatus Poribacteria bacterium]